MIKKGTPQCKICGSSSAPLAKTQVLKKFDVKYYSCMQCGFIQTESPYWLDVAYSNAIARSDIGLIGRNIKLSNFCAVYIPLFSNPKERFLDYGGGNGMFVRMMRDWGFNFFWLDKFAVNQFASGFEAGENERFAALTAFEVFEHLIHPLNDIAEMFKYSDTIIFTTRLLPRWRIMPTEWWYFTPDTGQHISLYSREALEIIAKKFNVHFSSNGISLHVFSSSPPPGLLLKTLSFSAIATSLAALVNFRRRSLLDEDYFCITGTRLG